MTGRYQPANIVGARLHRMATKENILQIMQGTRYHEIANLETNFELLKSQYTKSLVKSRVVGEAGGASADLVSAPPSPSPAKVPAASKDGSRTGGGLVTRALSKARSMSRVFSRSTNQSKAGLNSHN